MSDAKASGGGVDIDRWLQRFRTGIGFIADSSENGKELRAFLTEIHADHAAAVAALEAEVANAERRFQNCHADLLLTMGEKKVQVSVIESERRRSDEAIARAESAEARLRAVEGLIVPYEVAEATKCDEDDPDKAEHAGYERCLRNVLDDLREALK